MDHSKDNVEGLCKKSKLNTYSSLHNTQPSNAPASQTIESILSEEEKWDLDLRSKKYSVQARRLFCRTENKIRTRILLQSQNGVQMHEVLILLGMQPKDILNIVQDENAFNNLISCVIAAGDLIDAGLSFSDVLKASGYGSELNQCKKLATNLFYLKNHLKFTNNMIKAIIQVDNGGIHNLVTLCILASPMIAVGFNPAEITEITKGVHGFIRLIYAAMHFHEWYNSERDRSSYILHVLNEPIGDASTQWNNLPTWLTKRLFEASSALVTPVFFNRTKRVLDPPVESNQEIPPLNPEMEDDNALFFDFEPSRY